MHVACGEKQLERHRVRDTNLPEQEHAWHNGVLLKKRCRQCSDGRIAESILQKVNLVEAEFAHDTRQYFANFRNILSHHKVLTRNINRDAHGPVMTSNTC